jgi:hypothetical protein
MGTGVSFPSGEADHSPPSISEVKNACSVTSTPPYVFIAWYLVKQSGHFISTFYTLTFTFLDRRQEGYELDGRNKSLNLIYSLGFNKEERRIQPSKTC